MPLEKTFVQFTRFAVVGLASNGILYFLYLMLTQLGMGAKLSMTLLYLVGAAQSFTFNRRWSFEYRGPHKLMFIRYIFAYMFGYLINFFGLFLLVDSLDLPHRIVQAALIPTIAIALFLLHKFWVFADQPRRANR